MKANAYMGFSQEDITPQKVVQIVGYDARPDNQSRGVLHSLIAQTLVCKTSEDTCCLIAIDSLGFTVELTDILRQQTADCLNIKPSKVMVCFSHTHAAPNAAIEPEYYKFVCEKVTASAKRAASNLIPVNAGWGTAENTIGVNRRGSEHPIDRRLGILKICGTEHNDLKILLLRVTAHGNVLMPDNYLISSDYFGVTRTALEKKYSCKVMLIQGAAGNVRPKYRQENADYLEIHPAEAAKLNISETMQREYFKQSIKALENMAEAVCQSVQKVMESISVHPIETISMFSISLPFHADVPTMKRAREMAGEALKEAAIDGTNWLKEVERLSGEGIKRQSSNIEIQFFAVEDGCLCGIPNEAMSEIAVDIWKKSGSQHIFFNGYTNGCGSYLPTAEEYDKGGYEVLWSNLLYYQYHGRVMPFNRDTAKRLASSVAECWNKYKNG